MRAAHAVEPCLRPHARQAAGRSNVNPLAALAPVQQAANPAAPDSSGAGMSPAEMLRRGRDALGFLADCLRSRLDGSPAPSLLS